MAKLNSEILVVYSLRVLHILDQAFEVLSGILKLV